MTSRRLYALGLVQGGSIAVIVTTRGVSAIIALLVFLGSWLLGER